MLRRPYRRRVRRFSLTSSQCRLSPTTYLIPTPHLSCQANTPFVNGWTCTPNIPSVFTAGSYIAAQWHSLIHASGAFHALSKRILAIKPLFPDPRTHVWKFTREAAFRLGQETPGTRLLQNAGGAGEVKAGAATARGSVGARGFVR